MLIMVVRGVSDPILVIMLVIIGKAQSGDFEKIF